MKPTRNLYGIHNDFSGVGGGLRRGCILNKEQRLTFLALVNMVDATQDVGCGVGGWGDVNVPCTC